MSYLFFIIVMLNKVWSINSGVVPDIVTLFLVKFTPHQFCYYVNSIAIPLTHSGWLISLVTSYHWMHCLGYQPQEYQKSLYFNGHKKPDVVEYWTRFLEEFSELQRPSWVYFGENLESSVWVNPEILGEDRKTVFIYHEESTVQSKERPWLLWLLPGKTVFWSKDSGQLIQISDFIVETTGQLIVTRDCINHLISEGYRPFLPSFSDVAAVIHPRAKGNALWDMNQLISQIKTCALPIFEEMHPDCQGVFVFDCSSAHEAYEPNVFCVQSMNLSSDGKQAHLWATTIPSDDPHIPIKLQGQTQLMGFPLDHHIPEICGQPKGIEVVLQEHGLWDYHKNRVALIKKPPLLVKCASCKASGASQDAKTQICLPNSRGPGLWVICVWAWVWCQTRVGL